MILEMQRETFGEWLFRVLAKGMMISTITFLIAICVVMQIRNRKIADLEREYGVTEEVSVQIERIPVKEQVERYIDTLPIPERTQESEEEIVEVATEEIALTEVKIETEVTMQQEVVDESDEMLLAEVMHHEEGVTRVYVSPEEAKMAHLLCGSVVIHRKNMKYMGAKSIKDVIYAPGQYSSTNKFYTESIPEETLQWARELLQNGPIGPEDMIFQSQSEQGEGTYAHIYNQYFCCLTDPNVEEATEGIENTEVVTETEETMALAETQVP